ncbi:hypothetical protein BBD39_06090 [Arsenophonus endosymbiont of Bemisia tabaci Asia II 3]|nr:hypothetical protein BBD39_06090 [Arsenophonus endosymbiont of Bemisia tabaci Asia II 3]
MKDHNFIEEPVLNPQSERRGQNNPPPPSERQTHGAGGRCRHRRRGSIPHGPRGRDLPGIRMGAESDRAIRHRGAGASSIGRRRRLPGAQGRADPDPGRGFVVASARRV